MRMTPVHKMTLQIAAHRPPQRPPRGASERISCGADAARMTSRPFVLGACGMCPPFSSPHAAVWHGPLRTTCSQHIKTPYCLLPIRPLPQWCTQRCMLCAFPSNITLTRTPPATAARQKQVLSNTPTQHPFPNTATSSQEPQHHISDMRLHDTSEAVPRGSGTH